MPSITQIIAQELKVKKRRTKGQIAIEAGLQPLADAIMADFKVEPETLAVQYIDAEHAALDGKSPVRDAVRNARPSGDKMPGANYFVLNGHVSKQDQYGLRTTASGRPQHSSGRSAGIV